MKAVCWFGPNDIRIEEVPDPKILNPHDAIIKVTSTAICGSDLHLLDGKIPTMKAGDVLGHEFMGEVVETAKGVSKLKVGDRVVVPFTISCGKCFFCQRELYSLCDNTNPNAAIAEKVLGYATAGLFGYSHFYGGYPGGQAEYVRVPFADVGPIKVPDTLPDEKVLFLSDILPTGYMAAENCDIRPGDTVAVWGCGPVGLFAMACANLLGAGRVIGIDRLPERLEMARKFCGAEVLNYERDDIFMALREMTGGRGPDSCIDSVGMEAHGAEASFVIEKAKQALHIQADRTNALDEAIKCCRKGGTISVPGVYGGPTVKTLFGVAFAKGLTMRMGQTHVPRYTRLLLNHIEHGEIDPSQIITHKFPLEYAVQAYDIFKNKERGCIKVVLKPGRR